MNSCCFTNQVLYPSAYGFFYASGLGWIWSGTMVFHAHTAHLQLLNERLGALALQFRDTTLDTELDAALIAEEIEFDSPVHFVHYMDESQLLHMLRVYAEARFPGNFYEPHTYDGTPIAELSVGQLRKLVLLVYERDFGGTLAERDNERV